MVGSLSCFAKDSIDRCGFTFFFFLFLFSSFFFLLHSSIFSLPPCAHYLAGQLISFVDTKYCHREYLRYWIINRNLLVEIISGVAKVNKSPFSDILPLETVNEFNSNISFAIRGEQRWRWSFLFAKERFGGGSIHRERSRA